MLDEFETGEDALRIDSNQKPDRLSRITSGVDEVGIEIDESLQPVAAVGRDNGRITLRLAEAPRFRDSYHFHGLDLLTAAW